MPVTATRLLTTTHTGGNLVGALLRQLKGKKVADTPLPSVGFRS